VDIRKRGKMMQDLNVVVVFVVAGWNLILMEKEDNVMGYAIDC